MKHLGDITKINGAEIEPVHCIIGGSPCQDLSIAGKRAGLSGERSGLFMEQVRIVKEMREKYGTAYPRFMVWENVPGAFSSNKGADFAAVLTEIIRIVEPEALCVDVPAKGWSTWGGFRDMDGRWSVAWRVHDAQYWGVPQRRRRIALVADFGGDTASEILFERKSVSGDIAESGTARERPAGYAEAGAGRTGESIAHAYGETGVGYWQNGIQTLRAEGENRPSRPSNVVVCSTGNDQTIFQPKAYGISAFESNAMKSANPHSSIYEAETARTLDLNGGESHNHDGSGNGLGIGKEGDPSPTLTAGDRHGVMCLTPWETQSQKIYSADGVWSTLCSCENGGLNREAVLLDMSHANDVIRECGEISPSLQARMGTGGNQVPLVYSQQRFGEYAPAAAAATLRAAGGGYGGGSENLASMRYAVRRLTPLECERLQGFPDGWTDIGDWVDGKGKKHKSADSPRYKALGNSIALPFWQWMLRRMCEISGARTMGSLFDGIGGFPLCWERINGDGSCRWASEIEEFPIAVTKRHFKEE